MSNVISFTPSAKPDESIIELLEELLTEARAGELRALAISGLNTDRKIWCEYVAEPHFQLSLLGSLEVLKKLMLEEDEELE